MGCISTMTYAIMSYNSTIHSTTGLTPFEIVLGHTDSNEVFDVDFNKQYTQKMVQDHVQKTQYLYKHLTDKIVKEKDRVREKRGGETEFDITRGDTVFIKGVNVRRSKDAPRYQKAKVTGEVVRNTVPIEIRGRKTKTPIKDVKRLSQGCRPPADPGHAEPGPPSANGK